ncbi:unnamed protein product [Microthlaspi erraticum]|uniref:MATH domain-containing protein n=1 Tax=Microthlaspi erraticum TaxID=1685480 RepID=A0A6D2LHM2_9BRAS|nr:unnamed protein product [Microthlaspi erraticum]
MRRMQIRKTITWGIKNFSSLKANGLYSDQFVAGGCKWRLYACPKGNNGDYLFLYLEVADFAQLITSGLRRSVLEWVMQVVGKLDVTEETPTITESMDVNGFQLLPSQAEFVRPLFERHPTIASEFRVKNPNLRAGYMSLLLSLIETLRQPRHELSMTDMAEAYAALGSMTSAGLKLDWLKKKLDEMSEKKQKEEARVKEIEQEMDALYQRCEDLVAQLEKEKAEVAAAEAPLSFGDFI